MLRLSNGLLMRDWPYFNFVVVEGVMLEDVQLRYCISCEDVDIACNIARKTGVFTESEIAIVEELAVVFLDKGVDSPYYYIFADNIGVEFSNLIGYACYGPVYGAEGTYELYWIVVDRDYYRMGIGRKLLQAVVDVVKSQSGRLIFAETSNSDKYYMTRLFYEKNGFDKVVVIPDFYRVGDGKVIYRFELGK